MILACSVIGWVFLDLHKAELYRGLHHVGTLLTNHFASTSRYSILTKDQLRLSQLIDAPMGVTEVGYVVVTDANSDTIIARSKDRLTTLLAIPSSMELARAFPPDILLPQNAEFTDSPTLTRLTLHDRTFTEHTSDGESQALLSILAQSSKNETFHDFSIPIFHRRIDPSVETELQLGISAPSQSRQALSPPNALQGVIHIGLTDQFVRQQIHLMFWRVLALTGGIIILALAGALFLAARVVRPIQSLRTAALSIREGSAQQLHDLPHSKDEIGELSQVFNEMVHSLDDRERRLAQHVDRLEVLQKVGLAMSSTLDVQELFLAVSTHVATLPTVSRIGIFYVDEFDHQLHYGSGVGFSSEVVEAFQASPFDLTSFPQLAGHAEPGAEEHRNEETAKRPVPPLPKMIQTALPQYGIKTCDLVPILTDQTLRGVIVSDLNGHEAHPEDQTLLETVAHQLAIVMTKISTYHDLEALTHHLEQRIQERTAELEGANEQLQELDRLKTAFVSITSHELRTPLMAIHVFVDNLLQGVGGRLLDNQARYLSRIQANLQRLSRMVTELLDLSQIESGQMALHRQSFSIATLVYQAVADLTPLSERHAIDITVTLPPVLPPLYADQDKIHQVLTNLLHNAIKFSPTGGTIHLTVDCPPDGDLQIAIQDQGCGISQEEQGKIFRPFFRGKADQVGRPGAGLGLWVTKQLVELHGGQVHFHSLEGEGCCFTIRLPLSPQEEPVVLPLS